MLGGRQAPTRCSACPPGSRTWLSGGRRATAVNETSLRWLARAKDAAGIAGLFASDGVIFLENEAPVVGPAG